MNRITLTHRAFSCPRRRTPDVCRSGAGVLEAVLAIPILLFAMLAAFEFGVLALVHQAVLSAVNEGAREAANVPTTVGALDGVRVLNAAESAVFTILSTQGIAPGNVQLIVEDSDVPGAAAINGVRASGPGVGAVPATSGIVDPAEVRLTLRVELIHTRVPNLLATFGVALLSQNFDVSAIGRRDGF